MVSRKAPIILMQGMKGMMDEVRGNMRIYPSILLVRTLTVSVLTHSGVYGGIPGVYSHFSHSTPSKTPSLAYACTLQSNVRYNNIQCIIIIYNMQAVFN